MGLKYLYISLVCSVVLIAACNSEDSADYKGEKKTTNFGNGQDAGATGQFGSGQFNGSEEPTSYPATEYFGSGILKSVDDNPIQARIMQTVNENEFINHTLSFTSSDGNVNKEVVKLVGKTTYRRIAKSKIFELEKTQGFVYLDFLMYAESASSATGFGSSTSNFSIPMPFLVIPGDSSRYDSLKQQPVNYQVTVNGSGGTYGVSVSVELVSSTATDVQIRITANIPNDSDGKLYDQFPIAQSSVYHIDPVAKRVTQVDVQDLYYNSHKRARKNMWLNFSLCKYTQNGQTDTLPCGG